VSAIPLLPSLKPDLAPLRALLVARETAPGVIGRLWARVQPGNLRHDDSLPQPLGSANVWLIGSRRCDPRAQLVRSIGLAGCGMASRAFLVHRIVPDTLGRAGWCSASPSGRITLS
jgi:hypothetical protein